MLLVAGCGANSAPTQVQTPPAPTTAPEQPLGTPLAVGAPVPDPATALPAPVPVVGTETLLSAGTKDKPLLFERQCSFTQDQCDPSTVVLLLNGTILSYKPSLGTAAAPFGVWSEMNARIDKNQSIVFMFKYDTLYQHAQIQIDSNSISETSSKQWPTTIVWDFPELSITDDAGKTEHLQYQCQAFAMSYDPTDCQDIVVSLGNTKIYEEKDTIVSSDVKIDILHHENAPTILIATQPIDEEGESTQLTLLAKKDGTFQPTYQEDIYGTFTWQDDGNWSVEETICDRPANLRYSETGKVKVLKYGRESYRKVRYLWKDGALSVQAPKRWKNRKSECQTEGRCPYVYAGSSQTKLGEILRDQVGTEKWKNQFIEIPRNLVAVDGSLSIVVAEEKPDEITYIDAMWLEVGGQRIRADRCEAATCVQDRSTLSLSQGQSTRLQFSNIPATGTIRFFANGYYNYIY